LYPILAHRLTAYVSRSYNLMRFVKLLWGLQQLMLGAHEKTPPPCEGWGFVLFTLSLPRL
jgi:hypothetical protein